MSTRSCPRCGRSAISTDDVFCGFCGAQMYPSSQMLRINTHSVGLTIIAFLVSFLWFKINNVPLLPIGFFGALFIIYWSSDIDKAVGKQPLTAGAVTLSLLGMFLGFIIR